MDGKDFRRVGVRFALAVVVGCNGQIGSEPDAALDGGGVIVDASLGDADATLDSAADATLDGSYEAGTYNDMTNTSFWSAFDISGGDSGAQGFTGGAFDGRYVYLAPYANVSSLDGITPRYDTQASFALQSSWATYDVSGVNASAKGFAGAAFDGRYLYLVPFNTTGVVARYDTQTTFMSPSSWTTFDVSTLNGGARGFVGAAFDGRYIYLVPNYNGAPDGIVARYDTQATFTLQSSWATFNVSGVNVGATGFVGSAFDGRYLYFIPLSNGQTGFDGIVARYDTQAPFTMLSSWSTFDVATVDLGAHGFSGAAFDGRYLYLVPYATSVVARYDTQSNFTTAASWSTFDMMSVTNATGFVGAAFDGRYVYLVPYGNPSPTGHVVTRYDTLATFTTPSSWSTYDVAKLNAGAQAFQGAVFDGRYVYLVPYRNGIVARFDAKTSSSMPSIPGWFAWGPGSFL